MKVKLISDGGYRNQGEPSLIGKVFDAVPYRSVGYDILVTDLVTAGLVDAGIVGTNLFFCNSEVEVIDG